MSSNEKKAATLGMPHGTAVHRLRKNILFSMLKRLGEDICFQCGQTIESVDELSIEHKLPWEGRSAELFWDLGNIAFSHTQCNRPHSYSGGGSNKIETPEGMAWCSGCKKLEPVENFWKDASNHSGLQQRCKLTHHRNR